MPVKEVVPDTRTIHEIAVDTPLPDPAYTAKTVARHEQGKREEVCAAMEDECCSTQQRADRGNEHGMRMTLCAVKVGVAAGII